MVSAAHWWLCFVANDLMPQPRCRFQEYLSGVARPGDKPGVKRAPFLCRMSEYVSLSNSQAVELNAKCNSTSFKVSYYGDTGVCLASCCTQRMMYERKTSTHVIT